MNIIMPERRQGNRKMKIAAFAVVMAIFLGAQLIGDRSPLFDHLTHLTVLAYMATRVFVRM